VAPAILAGAASGGIQGNGRGAGRAGPAAGGRGGGAGGGGAAVCATGAAGITADAGATGTVKDCLQVGQSICEPL
jgi:hypothetical protein